MREVSQKSLENEVQNTLQQIEIAHLGIRHKKCAGDGNASIGDLFGYGFKPYVLVSPKSRVTRPRKKIFNSEMVIKADLLFREIDEHINDSSALDTINSLANLVSSETLMDIAKRIAGYHKPTVVDYYAKFVSFHQLGVILW